MGLFTDTRAIAVVLAGICTFLDLYATQALLPMLADEFGATPAGISLTVSATTLAVAFIAPFVGAVADVLGRKRIIVAAMFALTVPTLLVATSGSLPQMIFWRFVQGLLLPPVFAVTVAYVGEEWPPAQATAITGIYMSASSFGGFLSRLLTGLVAEHVGWRLAFCLLAVVTFGCAVGVLFLLPKERHFTRSGGLRASTLAMLGHLRNGRLIATFGIGFCGLFSFVAVFTYIDFVLAAPPFGLSAAALGTVFVVYLFGVMVTPLTGPLVARLGRRRLILIVIGIWLCALLTTMVQNLAVILVALAIYAACGFICQTCATSYVAISARTARSSAIGLYVTFYYIGGSAGAVIPGMTWDRFGWAGCVGIVATVLVAIAILVSIFWREPVDQAKLERG